MLAAQGDRDISSRLLLRTSPDAPHTMGIRTTSAASARPKGERLPAAVEVVRAVAHGHLPASRRHLRSSLRRVGYGVRDASARL